ncbi:MAG TPA: SigE family RNA polymerase sigma factor [Acidimicrobiales bacterium]|jgi:RNA polymerase sigma-70 factor (sigma-E family)|nr:SigE family RNA polymerase sigma factor [Acidimicrobiales bacterium]
MTQRDEEFLAFLEDRRSSLLRTSTALTGGDPHLAEDIVQKCLVRLYLAWPRIRSMHLDSYVRRSLVNAVIDERRGAFRRHEHAWAEPPDVAGPELENEVLSGNILSALSQLAPRMRAAVVLRHVDGLSTEETAHALRCSTGTVKSQTARGLERLRALLADDPSRFAESLPANRSEPTYQGETHD